MLATHMNLRVPEFASPVKAVCMKPLKKMLTLPRQRYCQKSVYIRFRSRKFHLIGVGTPKTGITVRLCLFGSLEEEAVERNTKGAGKSETFQLVKELNCQLDTQAQEQFVCKHTKRKCFNHMELKQLYFM